MTPSVAFERPAMLARLAAEQFDVLVVGGGITGVGTALEAASRGLRVALVERDDFASGTSSKSSKLVHGGLRYLQQGEVRLVYEALRERRRLCRNAPHLVKVLPFMIPVLTKDGVVSRRLARAFGSALWMYDLTGGWRIGKLHKRLTSDQALTHLPAMDGRRLASAYLYYDATVDDARLCLTVARTAAAHGAVVVNRCSLAELDHDANGQICGAVVVAGDRRIHVRATTVVNATGVWSDQIRAFDQPATHEATMRPAKGVHITLPWPLLGNDIAVVIPVRADKRRLFVVPFGRNPDGTFRHTYVGTTDTDYQGPLEDPQCTAEDIDYILTALNAAVTTTIAATDITGTWAGLRPLVATADPAAGTTARTADLSRRHRISRSPSGLITVAGGKLTTYREMAEDTVDEVVQLVRPASRLASRLARWRSPSTTKRLALLGADGFVEPPPDSPDSHLAGRYGTLAAEVRSLAAADPELAEPVTPGLPYLRAEVVYAARHEQATTIDDVLSRRTRARLLDRRAAIEAAPLVAQLMAAELGWDDAETQRQQEAFAAGCRAEELATSVSRT